MYTFHVKMRKTVWKLVVPCMIVSLAHNNVTERFFNIFIILKKMDIDSHKIFIFPDCLVTTL